MRQLVYGLNGWQPFERKIWMMAIAASVVWILYVVIADILFFQPKSAERLESEMIVTGTFNDLSDPDQGSAFWGGIGQRPSAADRGRLESIVRSNQDRRARNQAVQEYNDGFLWRGLAKAFGYPLAWMTALLTFIAVYERLQNSLDEDQNGST